MQIEDKFPAHGLTTNDNKHASAKARRVKVVTVELELVG